MKKILKIMLVLTIGMNFIFTNHVKVKASESKYSRWWVEFIHEDGTKHQSDWVEEGHSWGYSMDDSTGGTLKLIKKVRLYFDLENLQPNEKLHFEFDADFGGIKGNLVGTVHYFLHNGNWEEITPTILYEQGVLSPNLHHTEILEYENNSNKTYPRLIVEFNLIESSNIKFILTQVNNFMKKTYTDEYINEDTNTKVGGILEIVNSIFTGISEMPSKIASNIKGFFDNVVSSVTNIGTQITNMVSNIQTWLSNLLTGIINGLKSLFIPSEKYFDKYFDSLYKFFSTKLGILIMPFDILISFMNNILNLGNGDGFIHIPKIEFMDVNLIPKTDYNLKKDMQEVMGNYYDMYYMLTDVIIYFMLFNMAKKKFDEIVRGSN